MQSSFHVCLLLPAKLKEIRKSNCGHPNFSIWSNNVVFGIILDFSIFLKDSCFARSCVIIFLVSDTTEVVKSNVDSGIRHNVKLRSKFLVSCLQLRMQVFVLALVSLTNSLLCFLSINHFEVMDSCITLLFCQSHLIIQLSMF